MDARGGVVPVKRSWGCYTLGAKYRHAKLFAKRTLATGREKVSGRVNIDHGHIRLPTVKNSTMTIIIHINHCDERNPQWRPGHDQTMNAERTFDTRPEIAGANARS